jgi:hypothetical protein
MLGDLNIYYWDFNGMGLRFSGRFDRQVVEMEHAHLILNITSTQRFNLPTGSVQYCCVLISLDFFF